MPEDVRVTKDESIVAERIETGDIEDTSYMHVKNFIDAVRARRPLPRSIIRRTSGAAAVTAVNMGARSYREGKAFFLNTDTREISDRDPGWAARWEQMSRDGAQPFHVPGWEGGDKGSTIETLGADETRRPVGGRQGAGVAVVAYPRLSTIFQAPTATIGSRKISQKAVGDHAVAALNQRDQAEAVGQPDRGDQQDARRSPAASSASSLGRVR